MFTIENKDSQIKYLNDLISLLESNKDFTDTIDTIMYEFYIKKNNKNSNVQDSNELIINNFKNISENEIKKRLENSSKMSLNNSNQMYENFSLQ